MLGELVPTGPVPQAVVYAALALVGLLVCVVAPRRARGRGGSPPARARDTEALDLASAREQVAALREELAAARKKAEGNSRILVAIPECMKQLANAGLDEEGIPNVAVRQVKALLDPELAAFFRFDPGRRALDLASGVGVPAAHRGAAGLSLRLGSGRVGLAAEQRTLVDDAKYRYERQGRPDDGGAGLPVDLAAPVETAGELIGVLAIRGSRQTPEYQRWLLMTVADLAGAAVSGARFRAQQVERSTTDGLTGLHNRKYLATRLAEEVRRAESYGSPLSVILFDVDNFKHFNDRNGHPAGDSCLRAVATLTKGTVRSGHAVVRYGGEEFLVLAPGATLADAMAEAERIRETIATADIEHAKAQPLGCVSVSLGVATYPTHGRTGDELIRAADAALYRSKEAGRNRVTAAADGFLGEATVGVGHV